MLKAGSRKVLSTRRTASRSELAAVFYQLSRFLSVGIPLVEALEDISAAAAGSTRQQRWACVGQSVQSGQQFSEALLGNDIRIDNTVIAIIRSGEANGRLYTACESVNDYLRWHLTLRQRVLTILLYPVFSFCVLITVTGFLFISVVPSIEGFLLSAGNTLEWHTLLLLGVSDWVSEYFFSLATLITVVVALFVLLLSISLTARYLVDRCLLKIPLVGPVLIDLMLCRYARCCAQLYSSGIALETSLQLAEQAVGNHFLRTELAEVRQKVVGGTSLADALRYVVSLPSMFHRLVAVGERSGQLSAVLVQLGEQQSNAVDASVSRMEQLIGPVLLLLMGSILLWIVVSMLGPVYNMAVVTVVGAS